MRGSSIAVSDGLDLRVRQHLTTPGGVDIHEITPGEAAKGVPEEEVAWRLLPFLGGAVLIGHHVAFDVEVLDRLVRRNLGFPLLNRSYDTLALARRVDRQLGDPDGVAPTSSAWRRFATGTAWRSRVVTRRWAMLSRPPFCS